MIESIDIILKYYSNSLTSKSDEKTKPSGPQHKASVPDVLIVHQHHAEEQKNHRITDSTEIIHSLNWITKYNNLYNLNQLRLFKETDLKKSVPEYR